MQAHWSHAGHRNQRLQVHCCGGRSQNTLKHNLKHDVASCHGLTRFKERTERKEYTERQREREFMCREKKSVCLPKISLICIHICMCTYFVSSAISSATALVCLVTWLMVILQENLDYVVSCTVVLLCKLQKNTSSSN
jgi:hypothetical protein